MNESPSLDTPFSFGFGGAELIVILAIVGVFVLWIGSLIHCIRNKQLTDNNRIIGVVLIVVLGLLGSLIYLFLPRDAQQ